MEAAVTNIALAGYRGVGKTRIGQELSRRLGCEMVDTDAEVQRCAGCTIRELFQRHGEQHFRDLESEVVDELCRTRRQSVISLGGGAVLRPVNCQRLRAACAVVWLRARPEEIWRRLQADQVSRQQRPRLTDQSEFDEIVDVLALREPVYAAAADIQVETDDKPVGHVADEILDLLSGLQDHPQLSAWLRARQQ